MEALGLLAVVSEKLTPLVMEWATPENVAACMDYLTASVDLVDAQHLLHYTAKRQDAQVTKKTIAETKPVVDKLMTALTALELPKRNGTVYKQLTELAAAVK